MSISEKLTAVATNIKGLLGHRREAADSAVNAGPPAVLTLKEAVEAIVVRGTGAQVGGQNPPEFAQDELMRLIARRWPVLGEPGTVAGNPFRTGSTVSIYSPTEDHDFQVPADVWEYWVTRPIEDRVAAVNAEVARSQTVAPEGNGEIASRQVESSRGPSDPGFGSLA